jgi:hypothetical protein
MVSLTDLWLPILLAAVFVFLASSLLHMTPTWHRSDYPAVPDENALMNAVRPLAIPPGDYMVPRAADPAQMKSPEFREKINKGPVMVLTVMPSGAMSMGTNLLRWFLFILVVSVFAAYIASRGLGPGAQYLRVHQLAGASAFGAYVFAAWPISIWYHRSWGQAIKETVDGLIYASLTGGVFGWLWP